MDLVELEASGRRDLMAIVLGMGLVVVTEMEAGMVEATEEEEAMEVEVVEEEEAVLGELVELEGLVE